jgi:hypothetical protein
MGKNFWIKITVVLIGIILLHVSMLPLVDGSISIGLSKVSAGNHKNLIIGTSRIAQTLQPKALNDVLHKQFLNFAIDAATTSYSETYNKAIANIIPDNCKDGMFILAMDPWTITSYHDPNTGELMEPEKNSALGQQLTITDHLNIEYLIRDYNEGWGQILLSRIRSNSTVICHKDGWVEVTRPSDSTFVAERMGKKIQRKRKDMEHAFISESRKKSLIRLLGYLKERGDVYFVRLPVDPEFLKLEQEIYPGFDSFVDSLQNQFQIEYLDMQSYSSEVIFNDGHHINKNYAPAMSLVVANWIASLDSISRQ